MSTKILWVDCLEDRDKSVKFWAYRRTGGFAGRKFYTRSKLLLFDIELSNIGTISSRRSGLYFRSQPWPTKPGRGLKFVLHVCPHRLPRSCQIWYDYSMSWGGKISKEVSTALPTKEAARRLRDHAGIFFVVGEICSTECSSDLFFLH